MTTTRNECASAEQVRRAEPGSPDRSAWCGALVRDGRVGPAALAVGLLVAASDYRRSWPEFPMSSRNVSNRLALPLESVERIVAGLCALGYMSDTGRLERGGGPRHLMQAAIPARSEVKEDPDRHD